VAVALGAADEAPPAPIRDVAQLLHIHMDQVPGVGVFVAAHRFPGGAVEMGEPVDPTGHQDPVHRRGRHPEDRGDPDRSQALFPAQVHDLAQHRDRGRGR
jgi:hypothetical protein